MTPKPRPICGHDPVLFSTESYINGTAATELNAARYAATTSGALNHTTHTPAMTGTIYPATNAASTHENSMTRRIANISGTMQLTLDTRRI